MAKNKLIEDQYKRNSLFAKELIKFISPHAETCVMDHSLLMASEQVYCIIPPVERFPDNSFKNLHQEYVLYLDVQHHKEQG